LALKENDKAGIAVLFPRNNETKQKKHESKDQLNTGHIGYRKGHFIHALVEIHDKQRRKGKENE